MTASMNRSKLNRNTPAVITNNLNGNGGGNSVATNTASASYFSIQFLTRSCFASENLFNAPAPARRDTKYSVEESIADPTLAMNSSICIQYGFVVYNKIINAAALLGSG